MAFRNDPQSRVLPDTNTWLDAAFWPSSVARRAIAALQANGTLVLIEESIEQEALKLLAKRRVDLGISFDPTEKFKEFTSGFVHVPMSDLIRVEVNKADMPVARAAVHYKATLLTQDAPLIAECLADGICAKFPWNIITGGQALTADEILRIMQPSKRSGTIFARVTPGGWIGMKGVGEFTVADIENIGRLWFDSAGEEWVLDGVQSARMKFPSAGKGQSLVCASYDLPSSGTGKIILRAFSPQSHDIHTQTVNTLKKLKRDGGKVQIGASLAGRDHWNGLIRHLTTSPERMNAATWKAICDVPDAAPNPLNTNALNRGLLAMDGR
jgi:predicted nucleic acid-binding protein